MIYNTLYIMYAATTFLVVVCCYIVDQVRASSEDFPEMVGAADPKNRESARSKLRGGCALQKNGSMIFQIMGYHGRPSQNCNCHQEVPRVPCLEWGEDQGQSTNKFSGLKWSVSCQWEVCFKLYKFIVQFKSK